MAERDLICGIDRDVIESFLQLVKDRYPLVDEAVFFLEGELLDSAITTGITNQRDVLGHLSTLLNNPDESVEKQLTHLAKAEEHFRRGYVETYQQASALILEQVETLFAEYKRIVPGLKDPLLASAPNVTAVDDKIRRIKQARREARTAKAANHNDRGADAADKYVDAVLQLEDLKPKLEEYVGRARQIREQRDSKRRDWLSIGIGITGILFGILIAVFF